MSNKNKALRHATYQSAIRGIGKHFTGLKSLRIEGKDYKPSELIALLQNGVDATNRADSLRAQWAEAVAEAQAADAAARSARDRLKVYVLATMGDAADGLADFGFVPRKATKKDSATKALAVQKMRATRVARRTMGRKQRKKVKGTVG